MFYALVGIIAVFLLVPIAALAFFRWVIRRERPTCELCGDTENVLILRNGAQICPECKEEMARMVREAK